MGKMVLGVDIGGTFTDFALLYNRGLRVFKIPSNPNDPVHTLLQGLDYLGVSPDADIAHGTTVATNALLEGKGSRTVLLVTKGFEDLLEIGRQNRPNLYDFQVDRPLSLVPPELRIGVEERLDSQGEPLIPLTPMESRRVVDLVRENGAESVAISLLFSFLNPQHEILLRDAFQEQGVEAYLSISSAILPEYREYERTSTVTVNAYLGPMMERYINRLGDHLGSRLRIMHSGGGSLSADRASKEPVRTLLSGPAGGVMGAFYLSSLAGFSQIITLDMGGTSTDVSLCPGGVQETTSGNIGGYPITLPMIDIHTVGAGGGSIARLDAGGALLVGPESAGAYPGPVCYGQGDQVTVTDANLLLGRLDASQFLGGRMNLNVDRAQLFMEQLSNEMGRNVQSTAEGILRIVNSRMERAIRTISLERGYDPRYFTLVAYGGAGPMHACSLAEELGIPKVLIPPNPGVLSAVGVAMSDAVKDYSRTLLVHQDQLTSESLKYAFQSLEEQGKRELLEDGFSGGRIRLSRFLDMRYVGQSYELTIECPNLNQNMARSATRRFHQAHRRRYGHSDWRQPVELVTIRLKAIGLVERPDFEKLEEVKGSSSSGLKDQRTVAFDGSLESTSCYERILLKPGQRFDGPALVFQMDATTVIPPGWKVKVDGWRNLVAQRMSS
jgi:N-methylhydantoinase A